MLTIKGTPVLTREAVTAALIKRNGGATWKFYLEVIVYVYYKCAPLWGLRADVACCQMFLETDYCRSYWFGQNNFAGIGVTGGKGHTFSNFILGILAHLAHLAMYTKTVPTPLILALDPRALWVVFKNATTVADLAGKWAEDTAYGTKIEGIYDYIKNYH